MINRFLDNFISLIISKTSSSTSQIGLLLREILDGTNWYSRVSRPSNELKWLICSHGELGYRHHKSFPSYLMPDILVFDIDLALDCSISGHLSRPLCGFNW